MEKTALQLYSIKELTGEDFLGTIRKVAEIGYDGVEFAGYFNTPAKVLKKVLDDSGIKAMGSHIGYDQLKDHLEETIEYSLEIAQPYIICPYFRSDSADGYKRAAELFNRAGEKCKLNGIQLAYHNHDFEFEKFDGVTAFDIMFGNTHPDLLHIELDTFWVEYCGLRSINIMEKYGSRCSLLHIKDMKSLEEKVNTEVGKGVMDFKAITALAKKLGTEWYVVEQEEFEIPQLQSIEESLRYLKNIL